MNENLDFLSVGIKKKMEGRYLGHVYIHGGPIPPTGPVPSKISECCRKWWNIVL